jgi:ribosomal subunit interface protein
MNITIKATGIELTQELSEYVYKKIGPVEKYFNGKNSDVIARVEIGRSTEHHKTGDIFRAEVHIAGDGLDLYAVAEKEDTYSAIDIVKDEIVREARKVKDKQSTLARRGGAVVKNVMKGFSTGISRFRPKNFRKKK